MNALEYAFLRYSGISGDLSCDLVLGYSLRVLSVSGNDVMGTVPACMLEVRVRVQWFRFCAGFTDPYTGCIGWTGMKAIVVHMHPDTYHYRHLVMGDYT